MSLPRLTTLFHPEPRDYTGFELRPHFLLEKLGMRGSAIVAFAGGCRVATSELVDWEDRLAADRIEARAMVHFIGEFFGLTLREGVLFQRLFMAILRDETQASIDAASAAQASEMPSMNLGTTAAAEAAREDCDVAPALTRDGDDLFALGRKLSVSIVTASPVSILLHTGINIDPTGAPVPAIGLGELGVEPRAWAERVLKRAADEWNSMDWACTKVRPVI